MARKLKTILIVDDDEPTRSALIALLRQDYRTLAAPSAEEALPVLKEHVVDLMLVGRSAARHQRI